MMLRGKWVLVKPVRGGTAFWRSLYAILDAEKLKDGVEVVVLPLNPRANLYLVPVDVVSDLSDASHNLKLMVVEGNIDIVKWEVGKAKVRVVDEGYYRFLVVENGGRQYKVKLHTNWSSWSLDSLDFEGEGVGYGET